MQLRFGRALFLSTVMLAAGCGGSDDDDGSDDGDPSGLPVVGEGATSATGSVGSAGGVIRLESGSAVVIPAGALAEDVSVSIAAAPGMPEGAPSGPEGRPVLGQVLTTEPHGLTFAVPIQIRIATPPGLPNDRTELYTQGGDDGAWASHADVTLGGQDGLAVATTSHFSHWGWFAAAGGVAAIGDAAVLDAESGWAYYSAFNGPTDNWEIRRARLEAGATFETLYIEEPGTTLQVVAAGGGDLFFLRGTANLARMHADGSALDRDWATLGGPLPYYGPGFVTATHLYLANRVFVLATGDSTELPFNARGCAVSPDGLRAACSGREVVLATGAVTVPDDELNIDVPNGETVTDGTSWYFASQEIVAEGYIVKVAYGATAGTRFLSTNASTSQVAIAGEHLFVGNDTSITAYDLATGAVAGSQTVMTGAGAILETDGTTIWYAGFGATVQRLAVAALLD